MGKEWDGLSFLKKSVHKLPKDKADGKGHASGGEERKGGDQDPLRWSLPNARSQIANAVMNVSSNSRG